MKACFWSPRVILVAYLNNDDDDDATFSCNDFYGCKLNLFYLQLEQIVLCNLQMYTPYSMCLPICFFIV